MGTSKSPVDLVRVRAHEALAIYLVSDAVQPLSLRKEEDSVFLSAVSTSRFLDLSCANPYPLPRPLDSCHSNCCAYPTGFHFPRGYKGAPRPRPRTLVKLTSSARNRPVLAACGIDVVMPLQVMLLSSLYISPPPPNPLSAYISLHTCVVMPLQ